MFRRFASGIDKDEWDFDGKMNVFDLDDLKATQLRAPDRPAPIQGRRQTQHFDHGKFMGRNNGFNKIQRCSRCEEPGHNAKTCKTEPGDHARV